MASLLKNSVANAVGLAGPAIVQLVTLPFIVRALGDTDFGIYALVMAIVGYFAFLDLNLTVGAVKFIAEYDSLNKRKELNQIVSLGLGFYTAIGLVGAVLIFALSEPLVRWFFTLPAGYGPLAVDATRLAALGFLFGQLESFLTGVAQGLRRFTVSAAIQIASGFLTPVLTVLILWMGYGLIEVISLRVALGFCNVVVLLVITRKLIPDLRLVAPGMQTLKRVGSFSAFAYFSTVASIIYFQADKLIIGALIGVVALPYYVIPFTLASRLMGLTFRMAHVVYPEASRLGATKQFDRLGEIYFSATRYVFFANTGMFLVIGLFGYEILYYWMGPAYAETGTTIMVLILSALILDSTTNIPAMVNDGLGHPKVTGLFALGRALVGLALIAAGTRAGGIVGAAVGQFVTFALYAAALLAFVHGRTVPFRLRDLILRSYAPILIPAVALAASVLLLRPPAPLGLWTLIMLVAVVVAAWTVYGLAYVLHPSDAAALQTLIRRRLRGQS